MELKIEKARSLVESLLNGNNEVMSKEHFFMFTVSKFVALKELILKKDSDNKILFFDNQKNAKYVPCILKIADYVKENGYFHRNSLKITYSLEKERSDELDDAIWIFNKIRDSFAHGKYNFDLEKNTICIDNSQMSNHDPYELVCEFPIEIFDYFSFYISEIDNNTIAEEIDEKYNQHILDYSENYKIDIKNIPLYSTKIINNIPIKKNYDIINRDSGCDYIDIERKSPFKKPKENNVKIINELEDEMVIALLQLLLKNDNRLSSNKKRKIALVLKKYGFILNEEIEEKNDQEYMKKCRELLQEIAKILGVNNKNNKMVIPALYNYMQLVLGTASNIDYGHLKFRNLNISFDPLRNHPNVASNYLNRLRTIKSECSLFCDNLEYLITRYRKYTNKEFRKSLIDKFSDFYYQIINSLANKNELIVSSIRNSIEHGNFFEDKIGAIHLLDQSNQNDLNTMKFICTTNVSELFSLTKDIDETNNDKNFTIRDFFKELESIIGNEDLERLENTLNDLSEIIFGKKLNDQMSMEQMYQEAIVKIIDGKRLK